ncbi:MAG: penicillin-binding protein 1C [Mitsuaria chitosanitabida]|uniref:penicillin-binding protein 1C n=1 Tax=Roseateles chitosanitabidus TaxID=65048 RepID=UPI001B06BED7|nr:penicillin-binding protein 1C [Roseateles chitosanitabidus]MBO9689448.1 penicillin-binding protein 1C [Roseateles chitosanitabidus]
MLGRTAIRLGQVLALAAALAAVTPAQANDLPSFAQARAAHPVSDLTLLDRRGEPLQTLRLHPDRRVLPWVPLERMSPSLLRAMLVSEDQRFYEHSGVDWSAVAASAWGNLWNTRTRGASTVTMQLAGLLDEDLASRGGRSLMQKLGQAWVAGRLEKRWTKAQILEGYLNRVPLRGELIGVPAAAQAFFGKRPGGLDARESAMLAAMLRAPNASPAVIGARACGVLKAMGQGCEGLSDEVGAVLRRKPLAVADAPQWAPHFARLALKADGGAVQRSTLDAAWQRGAVGSLRRHLAELSGRQVEDGAVVVLDNASGEIRVWVGSSGSQLSEAAQVDHVLARRQPGSTLKPFLYELAIERRLITAASLLDDSPAQVSTAAGVYLPQNYDKHYRGWISARAALGNSLNVPAVRLSLMLTPEAVFERLNALGLQLPETGGFYGHSLALGSADVTLLALTNAYRALANGGRYAEVAMPGAVAPRDGAPSMRTLTAASARSGRVGQVADPRATFVVGDILADNNARALTFGLSSALALPFPASVKTGTSKDMRDNWCIGWSSRYTVGVWVGNSSGQAMQQVSGVSGAAPVWREVMLSLHAGRVPALAKAPTGVVQIDTRFEDPQEPPRREWFLAGTEQPVIHRAAVTPMLANPTDGAIYALDPDIPPAAQRLRFAHEGRLDNGAAQWRLDGRVIGRGATLDWLPMPGRHDLALLDARGRVLQQVKFEVRGVGMRTPPGGKGRPPMLTPQAAAGRPSPG